jgi:hypothetical protein
MTVAHGSETRSITEVREDDTTPRNFGSGYAAELLKEIGVGQPVEAVSPYAFRIERPRHRQPSSHLGQVVMERRVEAGNVGDARQSLLQRLDERN